MFDWDGASDGEPRVTEITTTLGQTAFLHCRVRHLGDRRVSRRFCTLSPLKIRTLAETVPAITF